ncbi:sterol desaturase family protein [Pandoraea sp.]|uniref:sterol desaturase family protein n=1 Tax=Pandoraea sp. TaxID=1883445 RepID=UPI0012018B5A|nr:sterol desaturase family protein [Pandoraea sp.]TAL55925.1 MAG: sterol desaturase family protein [Pandoraea sp.]TAM20540.1 MAG: sterol desaturase family protein [Pandoraea sp.]
MTDAALRLSLFLSLLALLAMAERLWPRHAAAPMRRRRWPVNFGLGAINVLCLRLLLPWLAIDAALWAQRKDFGLLHQLAVARWPAAVIAFVALDLTIYTQHRLMHRIGILWRLHRVHHTDIALDVSSGVRFHPLEILLSMGIKIAAVLALGASPAVVATFEIVLSSFSLLTHANLGLPSRLDTWLRWVLVTPDMHRIHHSVRREEHDTNYGFHLSWWDRLFGSYLAQPHHAQPTMLLGLTAFRENQAQGLLQLLIQPAE